MAQDTLYGVTIDVLRNNRRTAKSVLAALRSGAQRAHGRLDSAFAHSFDKGLPARLNAPIKSGLVNAEKSISSTTVNGVRKVTALLDTGLDKAFHLATEGIQSELAHKLYDAPIYGVISAASMPVARLSLKLSGNVADGAEKLAARFGHATAAPAPVVRRRAAKKPVAKKAAARKTATRRPRA
jgi:hypothetical protein